MSTRPYDDLITELDSFTASTGQDLPASRSMAGYLQGADFAAAQEQLVFKMAGQSFGSLGRSLAGRLGGVGKLGGVDDGLRGGGTLSGGLRSRFDQLASFGNKVSAIYTLGELGSDAFDLVGTLMRVAQSNPSDRIREGQESQRCQEEAVQFACQSSVEALDTAIETSEVLIAVTDVVLSAATLVLQLSKIHPALNVAALVVPVLEEKLLEAMNSHKQGLEAALQLATADSEEQCQAKAQVEEKPDNGSTHDPGRSAGPIGQDCPVNPVTPMLPAKPEAAPTVSGAEMLRQDTEKYAPPVQPQSVPPQAIQQAECGPDVAPSRAVGVNLNQAHMAQAQIPQPDSCTSEPSSARPVALQPEICGNDKPADTMAAECTTPQDDAGDAASVPCDQWAQQAAGVWQTLINDPLEQLAEQVVTQATGFIGGAVGMIEDVAQATEQMVEGNIQAMGEVHAEVHAELQASVQRGLEECGAPDLAQEPKPVIAEVDAREQCQETKPEPRCEDETQAQPESKPEAPAAVSEAGFDKTKHESYPGVTPTAPEAAVPEAVQTTSEPPVIEEKTPPSVAPEHTPDKSSETQSSEGQHRAKKNWKPDIWVSASAEAQAELTLVAVEEQRSPVSIQRSTRW